MSLIKINKFLGLAPKIDPTLLGQSQAQVAVNSKLWSESLRPFSGNAISSALSKSGVIQSLYSFDANTVWLHWTQDVDVVRGNIAGDTLEKTYFTGTDKPRVTNNVIFNAGTTGTFRPPDSYILGLPVPTGLITATDGGSVGNLNGTYSWVFTFCRHWSDGSVDEGPPCAPSNLLTLVNRNASLAFAAVGLTPGDYGITHVRIYRASGGLFNFQSEVAVGTTPVIDNTATTALGSAIATTFYLPPPDGMIGLIALPNGITAGFMGNTIYLSEPYRPWTYPLANQYAVNWPIVALGSLGTTIVAATTANPFIGAGVDPAGYTFVKDSSRYSCVSKRGMASAQFGVVWPAPQGLAFYDGTYVRNLTHKFLSIDEWTMDFVPSTMHAKVHDDRYFAWFTNGSAADGRLIGGGIVFDASESAFLVTLGEYVTTAYSIPDLDTLYVVKQLPTSLLNYTYVWEGDPTHPLAFDWRSKIFLLKAPDNYAYAQVVGSYGQGLTPAQIAALQAQIAAAIAFNATVTDTFGELGGLALNERAIDGDNQLITPPSANYSAGTISFQYYVDGVLVYTKGVSDNNPFPLPSGFIGLEHEVELGGTVDVQEVKVATSMEELASA